ncbi:hypothetical protein [Sessilibacter sp. MAH2]
MVKIDGKLIPPIKDYKELIEWMLSFGVIPFGGALLAFFLSSVFEVHNKISKVIQLRYLWDKYFIVVPMLKRIGPTPQLSREKVREIMTGLYYPEVKNIDQHYIHVFWRYALQFWGMFEHFIVVLVVTITLYIGNGSLPSDKLLWYCVLVFIVTVLHWFFVTTNKSTDQAKQIPETAIRAFMRQ